MTRHRFRIIRFFILVLALTITNGVTVSPSPVNTPHATTATIASAIHIGVQPACAKKTKKTKKAKGAKETWPLWTCTCQKYSDHRGCWGACRGKHKGHWKGEVRDNGIRMAVEKIVAHAACEEATASEGVDCQKCSCGRR